jgi:hypothetical protein
MIIKVLRMGRKMSEETIRPTKVVFKHPEIKFKFLRLAYELKNNSDDTVNSVILTNDRTPKEIQQYKQLRAQIEDREKKGETDLVIRRGKIVNKPNNKPFSVGNKINSRNTDERLGHERQEREQENSTDSDQEINLSSESVKLPPENPSVKILKPENMVEPGSPSMLNRRAPTQENDEYIPVFSLSQLQEQAKGDTIEGKSRSETEKKPKLITRQVC